MLKIRVMRNLKECGRLKSYGNSERNFILKKGEIGERNGSLSKLDKTKGPSLIRPCFEVELYWNLNTVSFLTIHSCKTTTHKLMTIIIIYRM